MKKTILTTFAATMMMAAPALAWEGKTVACYDKVWVGAKYTAVKELVKPAKTKYEHKNGHIEKVYYAPVYIEKKTKVSDGYYVMKKIKCHH
jgi:hypothetical protein